MKHFKLSTIIEGKVYRNVTHGTSMKNAKQIQKNGFELPSRNALFFDSKGVNGNLASIYGSDVIIAVDLFPENVISMKDVRSKIMPEMKEQNITMNEASVHKFLIVNGYDMIDNNNELIVLDPKIIKIKSIKSI